MTRSELILEFIDGTLDGNAEQQLFDELARQPEYRSEMRQFIAIGEAVRSDREAFMPPLAVEQSLMAGLGLAPFAGGAAAGGAAAGGVIAGGGAAGGMAGGAAAPAASFIAGLLGKLGLMKGLLPFFASFLLGGIIVGGGVYLGMKDSDPSMAASTSAASTSAASTPAASMPRAGAGRLRGDSAGVAGSGSPARNAPAASVAASALPSAPVAAAPSRPRSFEWNDRVAPVRSSTRSSRNISRRTNPPRIDDPALAESRAPRESLTPTLDSSTPASSMVLPAISSTNMREGIGIALPDPDSMAPNASRSPAAVRPIEIPEKSAAPERVVVELRGAATILRNENNAKVMRSKPVREVFSAGFSYRLDENFQFGIELGRERFWESYYYTSPDASRNTRVFVDQAPLLTWIGFSGRYNAVSFAPFEEMTPFAQLTLGGTSHGPLARARLGAQFDMSALGISGLATTVSAEGSTLLYFYNKQSLASTNAGVSFGLEYTLW